MKDIKINGKKLVLKKVPLKTMKEYFEIIAETESLENLEDNAENNLKVIETLEKAQNILPRLYNLTKKEVEEFDVNDITLAISAFSILLQEQTEKQQNTMKEYVENFQKN